MDSLSCGCSFLVFFFSSLDFDFASCIGDDHSEQCSTFMLMKDSCVVADSSSNGLHSKSLSSCYSLLKYVEVGLVFAPSPREGRIQEAIEKFRVSRKINSPNNWTVGCMENRNIFHLDCKIFMSRNHALCVDKFHGLTVDLCKLFLLSRLGR